MVNRPLPCLILRHLSNMAKTDKKKNACLSILNSHCKASTNQAIPLPDYGRLPEGQHRLRDNESPFGITSNHVFLLR